MRSELASFTRLCGGQNPQAAQAYERDASRYMGPYPYAGPIVDDSFLAPNVRNGLVAGGAVVVVGGAVILFGPELAAGGVAAGVASALAW